MNHSQCTSIGWQLQSRGSTTFLVLLEFCQVFPECAHACLCIDVHVEVRRQLEGVASPWHVGPGNWTQTSDLTASIFSHWVIPSAPVSISVRQVYLTVLCCWVHLHCGQHPTICLHGSQSSPAETWTRVLTPVQWELYYLSISAAPVLLFEISLTIQDVVRICMNCKILGSILLFLYTIIIEIELHCVDYFA